MPLIILVNYLIPEIVLINIIKKIFWLDTDGMIPKKSNLYSNLVMGIGLGRCSPNRNMTPIMKNGASE